MEYNSLIPLAKDRLYVSQGDMLSNFQSINTVFRDNHRDFNLANQGKHEVIQLTRQATDPSTLGTNIAALYNLPSTEPTSAAATTLAFRRENNGAVIKFSEFGFLIYTNKDFTGLVPPYIDAYWNRLPNGTLIKMFTVNINVNPSNSSTAAPLTTTFNYGPAFTAIRYVSMIPQRSLIVDPNNTATGDPNVVLYVISNTSSSVTYIAFTRNDFNFGRRSPKQEVTVRIMVWGT